MAANPVEIRSKLEKFIAKHGYPHEAINRIVGFPEDMQITIPFTAEQCGRVSRQVGLKLKELHKGNPELHWIIVDAMGYLGDTEQHAILQQIMAEKSGAHLYPAVRFSSPPSSAAACVAGATSAFIPSVPAAGVPKPSATPAYAVEGDSKGSYSPPSDSSLSGSGGEPESPTLGAAADMSTAPFSPEPQPIVPGYAEACRALGVLSQCASEVVRQALGDGEIEERTVLNNPDKLFQITHEATHVAVKMTDDDLSEQILEACTVLRNREKLLLR